MYKPSRRVILQTGAFGGALAIGAGPLSMALDRADQLSSGKISFGLVTYQWAKDWDLPTLLANCEKSQVLGVELRTTHAHGVEPGLNATQRKEVRQRFSDSPVTLVGLGSDERFDNPDPAVLAKAIEATKAFVVLSHDVGGTGVKVKPDKFHDGVPREQTMAQIARALNQLGQFGAGYGQQIRLEVHGQCAPLPIIQQIMNAVDHENVAICWNSNRQDLEGKGLDFNFGLVKDRLGATCHIHDLARSDEYPFPRLFELLAGIGYEGWALLEDARIPQDPVAALAQQRVLFGQMVDRASGR
jgi:sugar phosphate isomerase/epimerase